MTMAKKDKKSEGLKRNLRIENLENRQLLSAMSVVDADAAAFAPALLDQPTVDFGDDAVIAPEDVAAEAAGTKSSAVAIGNKITFSTSGLTNGAADGYYTVLITTTKIAKDASTSSYQTVKYVKDANDFVLSYTGAKSTSYKGDYKFDVLEGKLSKTKAIEAAETEANIKATASVNLLDTPKLTLVKDVIKDNPKTPDVVEEIDTGNVTDDLFTFTSTQLDSVALTNLTIKGAFNGEKTVTTYTVKRSVSDYYLYNGNTKTAYEIAYSNTAKEFTISGLDPNKSQSIQISYKTDVALSSFSNKLSVKTEKVQNATPSATAALTVGAEASSITITIPKGDYEVGQRFNIEYSYSGTDSKGNAKTYNPKTSATLKQVTGNADLWVKDDGVKKTYVATNADLTQIDGYSDYAKYKVGEVQQTKKVKGWTDGANVVLAESAKVSGLTDAKAVTEDSVVVVLKGLKANTTYQDFKITAAATTTKAESEQLTIKKEKTTTNLTIKTHGVLVAPKFTKTAITDTTATFKISNWADVENSLKTGSLISTTSKITITYQDVSTEPLTNKELELTYNTNKKGWVIKNDTTLVIASTGAEAGIFKLTGLSASTKYTVNVSTKQTKTGSEAAGTSRAVTVTTAIPAWGWNDGATLTFAKTDATDAVDASNILSWTPAKEVNGKGPTYYQVTATSTENAPTVTVRVKASAITESETTDGNTTYTCIYDFGSKLKANVEYNFTVVALKDSTGSNSTELEPVLAEGQTGWTAAKATTAQAPVVTATVASKVATVTANVGTTSYDTGWVFKVALTGTGTYTSTVLTDQTIMDTLTFTGTNLIKTANNSVENAVLLTATGSDGTVFEVKAYYDTTNNNFKFTFSDNLNSFSGKLTMTYGVETTSTKWVGSGYDTIEF